MKKLNVRQFGIGTLMKSPPLISFDSKYLFTLSDGLIYIWIVESGQLFRILKRNSSSSINDSSNVVSMAFNPLNRLQLCVAEQNGNIHLWDYEDGILIHTIDIQMDILQLFSILNRFLIVLTKTSSNVYSLHRIDSIRHYSSSIPLIEKFPTYPQSLSLNRNGNWGIFHNVEGTNVYFIDLETKQMKIIGISKQNLSYHQKIVCAQIHPDEECFALGTQSGRIALRYDFLHSTSKQTKISYLHWHSLPVLSLTFSLDGSNLYSGGYECVLVKWIYRRSEPTFRPRLGAPIIFIQSAEDQAFTVTTHSDNLLHIISSNLTIQQTISGINERFFNEDQSYLSGLHVLMRERAILMNSGQPGYLQLISIDDGKLIYNLDIVGENFISPNEITCDCIYTDIKRVAIHSSENWLVTFEEKYSKQTIIEEEFNERKVRFWKYKSNENDNRFELNTTITSPHGLKTINEMCFHPDKLQLITTGKDGLMKIWSFIDENPLTKRQGHWRCVGGQSYRSYECSALSFYKNVEDQWNLLTSFEHLVTNWIEDETNENSYEYHFCFSHYDRTNHVRALIHSNEILFVIHQREINLWNTTNRTFLKSFPWIVHSFAKDPRSTFLACFEKNFIHFYSFDDGKSYSRKNSLFRHVKSSLFIPNHQSSTFQPFQHSKLVFAVHQQGLKTFVDDDEDGNVDPLIDFHRDDQREMKKNILSQMILQSEIPSKDFSSSLKRKSQFNDDFIRRKDHLNHLHEQLLSTPSYLFPSIEQFCLDSLKQMLQPNSNIHEKMESNDHIDEEEQHIDEH